MSTNAKCGTTGSISLGGEIKNWELVLEEDIPDATSMLSAGKKEYIPCLKSASGSFESLIPCGAIGAHAGVEFINATNTYTLDIIVTDITLTDNVEDAIIFKYSFVSTGTVGIA